MVFQQLNHQCVHLLPDLPWESPPRRQDRSAMKELQLNRLATKASSHQHLLAIPLRDADLLPPTLIRLHAAAPAMRVEHRRIRPVRLQEPSTRTPPHPPSTLEARAAASDHQARRSHGGRFQTSSPSSARPGLSSHARDATDTKRQPRYYGRFVVRLYHGSRTHLSLDKDSPEPRSVEPSNHGRIVEFPMVGSLHHRYSRLAA